MSAEPQAPVVQESPVRLASSLAIAGLIAGVAIVGAYEATLPTITANKAAELREGVLEVLPGSTRLEGRALQDGKLIATEDNPKVYAGLRDDGSLVGYAIPAEGGGFQDTIKLLFGFDPRTGKIVGYRVLDSRETPGLGDRIFKDKPFVAQFKDLAVEPTVILTKPGQGTQPFEVDSISGATISSRAVVKILNGAMGEWKDALSGAAEAQSK